MVKERRMEMEIAEIEQELMMPASVRRGVCGVFLMLAGGGGGVWLCGGQSW